MTTFDTFFGCTFQPRYRGMRVAKPVEVMPSNPARFITS